MRDYTGIAYFAETEPTRRESLAQIDYFLRDLSRGMRRISDGLVPDGSGAKIADAALSDLYWALGGRSGNQVGFGGTSAAGTATIGSTAHPTKGFVYLGSSAGVAFDETAGLLGIGTGSPAVKVHANIASSGTTNPGDVGTPLYRGSHGGATLFDLVPVRFRAGVIDTGIKPLNAAFQIVSTDGVSGMRLVSTGSRAFVQAGYFDGAGTVQAKNMTLGGLGAEYGSHLGVAFEQVHFDNGSVNPQVGFGLGANPSSFGAGAWKGIIGAKGKSTTEPAITLAPSTDLVAGSPLMWFSTSLFGSPHITFELGEIATGFLRQSFWLGATRAGSITIRASEIVGQAKITFLDGSASPPLRTLSLDSFNRWSDTKRTAILNLGDTVSGHSGAAISGLDSAVLDRLSIASKLTLFSDAAPGGAVTPPTAMLEIRNLGVTATLQRWSNATVGWTAAIIADGAGSGFKIDGSGDVFIFTDTPPPTTQRLVLPNSGKYAILSDDGGTKIAVFALDNDDNAYFGSSQLGASKRDQAGRSAYFQVDNVVAMRAYWAATNTTRIRIGDSGLPNAQVHVVGRESSKATLRLKGAASQSENMLIVEDENNVFLSGMSSAGAYRLEAGKGAGKVLQSDANGIGSWTAASTLATRVVHRWVANGPYKVDTNVDGGWIAPTAMTITAVWLHRTTAGSSGQSRVDIHKNGTTLYTTQDNRPTILFNDADNKVQAALPDVVAVSAGDILTLDIDEVEAGTPRHLSLTLEGA